MSLFSLFIPQTILHTSSQFNPDIRIINEWGGLKLLVNGSRQSGPYIRKLWKKAFRAFHFESVQEIHSILVLGIGGGTVIELLSIRYPQAIITAIDIDQTMIDIAKKYFHLDRIPRLSIRCEDANRYDSKRNHFDLIIIDLFIGREIPSFVETRAFSQRLKRILTPGGRLILNYLRELEYQGKSDGLLVKLNAIFPDVRDYPIANNRFFFARVLDKRV